MKAKKLLLTASVIWMMTGQLQAQQQPLYFQTLNCIKVMSGKAREFTQFARDTSMKVAQMRADAGEILTWSLLGSVMPAGQEARCSHMIATLYEGSPRAPLGPEGFEKALQKAGVNMTASEWTTKANSLSSLVSTEMWRHRIRVGAPQKDHYLFLNYMKVHDGPEYNDFENAIWRPMAEAWIREGSQSGWVFATKVLPFGTETAYAAYSADIFPTWDAVFKQRSAQATFEKIHSGKNYLQTMDRLPKLRDLARRELWVIVERVAKK